MSEIKSAMEKAMEKAEKLGKPSEEDLMKWKYVPEGEMLAVRHLKDECDLVVEIGRYDDSVRQLVAKGAQGVLLRNIGLPRNDMAKRKNKRVMEAIKVLKHDKVGVENVFTNMRRIFDHYEQQGEQQRKQAYEALKNDFEAKVQQATQQQLGSMRLDVEKQPQFQEEWRRVQAQLDSQYLRVMDEYKEQILSVS